MVKKQIRQLNLKNAIDRPVIAVKRTNKHIYCDIIDSKTGLVLDSSNDLEIKKGMKSVKAASVGKAIAEIALKKKITKVVFDRKQYKYHGRVKALAEAARKNGLEF